MLKKYWCIRLEILDYRSGRYTVAIYPFYSGDIDSEQIVSGLPESSNRLITYNYFLESQKISAIEYFKGLQSGAIVSEDMT